MTARTLDLTDDHITRIRRGAIAVAVDSDGAEVDVAMFSSDDHGVPRLTLSPTDLAAIETPEGLVCSADGDRSYGWTVRMVQVPA